MLSTTPAKTQESQISSPALKSPKVRPTATLALVSLALVTNQAEAATTSVDVDGRPSIVATSTVANVNIVGRNFDASSLNSLGIKVNLVANFTSSVGFSTTNYSNVGDFILVAANNSNDFKMGNTSVVGRQAISSAVDANGQVITTFTDTDGSIRPTAPTGSNSLGFSTTPGSTNLSDNILLSFMFDDITQTLTNSGINTSGNIVLGFTLESNNINGIFGNVITSAPGQTFTYNSAFNVGSEVPVNPAFEVLNNVPEPSSSLLVALAGMAFAFKRNKKS